VGEILDEILFDQLVDDLVTETVDIHGVAPGKMQNRFAAARGTGNIDAAVGDFALGAVNARAAYGAVRGHLERLFFGAVLHYLQHVRDYFAGALDEDRITRVNIEPLDLVHVVQRGFHDGDAANLHRLENGEGREHARAADADEDVLDDGGFLVRGIFVGDRPARRLRREAELVLQTDFVYFHDNAIDFVGELFALRIPAFDVALDFRQRMTEFPV